MKFRPMVAATVCAIGTGTTKAFPFQFLFSNSNTSTPKSSRSSSSSSRRRLSLFTFEIARKKTGTCVNQFYPHNNRRAFSSLGVSHRSDAILTKATRSRTCIAVPENIEHRAICSDIAETLGLPLFDYQQGSKGSKDSSNDEGSDTDTYDNCIHISPYQYQSVVESYAISIQPMPKDDGRIRKRQKKHVQMQPYYIDFCPPPNSKLGKRMGKGKGNPKNQGGGEIVLKAVAPLKTGENGVGAVVFDFNAGFGQDSIIMACGGASTVHMIERDPIVGLLLNDAMRRLKLVSSVDIERYGHDLHDTEAIFQARELCEKLVLHQGDSIEFSRKVRSSLASNEDGDAIGTNVHVLRPDVCYLDPMFPPRTKSSAVKKNMQILHGLFQNQSSDEEIDRIEEEQALLEEALMLAKKRVVVKRPVTASPLGTRKGAQNEGVKKPSYELKGSVNRFDVYVQ